MGVKALSRLIIARPAPNRQPERRPQVFTYRLILKDGSPADPPQFVTATPTWDEGDIFMSRPGRMFRILAINDGTDDFHAIWKVELK